MKRPPACRCRAFSGKGRTLAARHEGEWRRLGMPSTIGNREPAMRNPAGDSLYEGDAMKRPKLAMGALKLGVLLVCLGLALRAGDAAAADIKVLSTGNMQSILGALTADFEGATGHKLAIEYGSTPKMKTRIE